MEDSIKINDLGAHPYFWKHSYMFHICLFSMSGMVAEMWKQVSPNLMLLGFDTAVSVKLRGVVLAHVLESLNWVYLPTCAIGSKVPLFPYNRGWETQPNSRGL